MTQDNALQQMCAQGQSPWIDNITRDMFGGELQGLIDEGITGLTSNPTIFQKAIGGSKLYDSEFKDLVEQNKGIQEIYDAIILEDIASAAKAFRPVFDKSEGRDGFVSIEVPPNLAHEVDKTLDEARRLWEYLKCPNVMVKIPGTPEGLTAYQRAIAEGININVTLLFALDTYRKVAEAYIAALEERAAAGKPIDHLASVASFFVSRVDTAVDKQLDAKIDAASGDEAKQSELRALKGKAAIANAKLAYKAYGELFSGARWEALAAKGARPQRCLWASTSTKNPEYRDVMYVEQLIGSDTVDTMPPATIKAVLDHGKIERTIDRDVNTAQQQFDAIKAAGISMDDVTMQLQVDGVRLFEESFNELVDTIRSKRGELAGAAR